MKRRQVTTNTAAMLLAALGAAAFWRVLGGDFKTYDDSGYVTANPMVLGGLTLRGVAWAFTTATEANWHPLAWLSHMTDVELFGLDPFYHHAVSVLLQIAAAILLFAALLRLTQSPWRSLFVAAVFAVHPLQVESVAWIAERKDVLSGFFCMLTMLAYARYVERPGPKRYAAVCAGLLLGLMAKPSLVVLPVLFLLLDYWPLARLTGTTTLWQLTKEKLPLFALAVLSGVVTLIVQNEGGAMDYAAGLPVPVRLGNAAISVVRYLGKAFWPSSLAVLYPHPGAAPVAPLLGSLALEAGVTFAVLRWRRQAPYLVTGWFWFLAALAPAIGIIQVGLQAMADRYMHLPIVGIAIAVAWGAAEVAARAGMRPRLRALVGTGVVTLAGVLSMVQAGYWENSVSLFQRTVDVTENNWVAHNNLGVALEGERRLGEALVHYREALRINPNYMEASINLANGLAREGSADAAVSVLREAVTRHPRDADLGVLLGGLLEKGGRPAEAAAAYDRAYAADSSRLDVLHATARAAADAGLLASAESLALAFLRKCPDSSEAHDLLGTIYAEQGKIGPARTEILEALRLDPENATALCNLGIAYDRQGMPDSSVLYYEAALRIDPQLWNAHRGLGALCARRGDVPGAIEHFSAMVRIRPKEADGHNNLGKLFELQGRTDSAAAHYAAALAIDPGHVQAHYNMGVLLARSGNNVQAAEHLRSALAGNPDLKEARDLLRRIAPEGGPHL